MWHILSIGTIHYLYLPEDCMTSCATWSLFLKRSTKAQTDALFQSLRTLEQQRDIRDVLALTIAPTAKQ